MPTTEEHKYLEYAEAYNGFLGNIRSPLPIYITFYHSPCLDGELAKNILEEAGFADIAIPVPPKFSLDADFFNKKARNGNNYVIIFADVCPSVYDYKKLLKWGFYNIILIDHHATAIRRLDDFIKEGSEFLDYRFVDDKLSGSALAHKFVLSIYIDFQLKNHELQVLKFVNDQDLGQNYYWNDKNKISKVFASDWFWDKFRNNVKLLFDKDIYDITMEKGKDKYEEFISNVTELKQHVQYKEKNGFKFVILDSKLTSIQNKGNLASWLTYEFKLPAAVYEATPKVVKSSWRVDHAIFDGTDKTDVSKFLENYGGGGHAKASGLWCDLHTWNGLIGVETTKSSKLDSDDTKVQTKGNSYIKKIWFRKTKKSYYSHLLTAIGAIVLYRYITKKQTKA